MDAWALSLHQAARWIEQSAPAKALAESAWAYPLVSTAHLLGLALLLGSISTVDLWMMGWRRVAVNTAGIAQLRRTAAWGLALSVTTGACLWSVRASDYLDNPWMWAKWGLLALALMNIAVFHAMGRRRAHAPGDRHSRVAGGVSLACWLGVLVCGRWIAFA